MKDDPRAVFDRFAAMLMDPRALRCGLPVVMALFLGWGCASETEGTQASTQGGASSAPGTVAARTACAGPADCAGTQVCREERCLTLCAGDPERCAADEACDPSGLCRPLICELDSDCPQRNETCQEGVCDLDPELDCLPNSRACDVEGALVICSSAGEIFERRDCGADAICIEDGEGASCVTQQCTPGERTCAAVDVVGVCSPSGDEIVMQPCAAEQYCENGACLDRICDPAQAPSCEGSEIVVCAPNGDREFVVVDCDPLPCVDGACDGLLSDGCTPGDAFRCYDGEEPATERGLCNYGTRTCDADRRFGPCEGWTTPAENPCPEEVIECPQTPRTRLLAGSSGELLRAALGDAGFAVRDSGLLTADDLDDADVIIVRAAFATLDNRRMLEWVSEEGGVLIVHGSEAGTTGNECNLVNSTIGPLGLRFDCANPASGPIAGTLGAHPLTEGMSAADLVVGPGPAPLALDPARTTVLAEGSGGIYALAAERDCGKVLLLSSVDALRDQPGDGPAQFRRNLVEWLAR